MKDASWINIHNFGGTDVCKPVIEVRTMGGYGARWSAVWKENVFTPEENTFRGFLEPQMGETGEALYKSHYHSFLKRTETVAMQNQTLLKCARFVNIDLGLINNR